MTNFSPEKDNQPRDRYHTIMNAELTKIEQETEQLAGAAGKKIGQIAEAGLQKGEQVLVAEYRTNPWMVYTFLCLIVIAVLATILVVA